MPRHENTGTINARNVVCQNHFQNNTTETGTGEAREARGSEEIKKSEETAVKSHHTAMFVTSAIVAGVVLLIAVFAVIVVLAKNRATKT